MKEFSKYKVSFAKGSRIFSQDDPGENMYIIHSGRIRIFREVGSQSVEFAVLEKGDFFGEMALFEHQPRSASAEAVEDSELLSIDPPTFADMIRANPEIAVRMLRKYCTRLREANRRIEELAAAGATLAGVDDMIPPRALVTPQAPEVVPPRIRGSVVVEGSGRVFTITKESSVIGRLDHVTGMRPEIDLSAEDVSRHISRRHARITYRDGKFFLSEEVGAMNGTFINGVKLAQQGVLYPLENGDRLSLCQLQLLFRSEP
ncbi:MAG: cyclic nucleotide-binding domain-containing protein [Acidobacteriota bacterium]